MIKNMYVFKNRNEVSVSFIVNKNKQKNPSTMNYALLNKIKYNKIILFLKQQLDSSESSASDSLEEVSLLFLSY